MKRGIVKIADERNDALSRISHFMSNSESGIVLSAKEEMILDRWIYCNALLKERKFTEEQIIESVIKKFNVSKFTARGDISNTMSLFAGLVRDLKKYTLHHHIEDIRITIEQWKKDRSLAPYVPKLMDSLTKAVAALPDEMAVPDVPMPVLVINVKGNMIMPAMDAEKAREEIDKLIELEEKVVEIEYEEVKKA